MNEHQHSGDKFQSQKNPLSSASEFWQFVQKGVDYYDDMPVDQRREMKDLMQVGNILRTGPAIPFVVAGLGIGAAVSFVGERIKSMIGQNRNKA